MKSQVVLVIPPFNDAYPGAKSPVGDRLSVGYLAAVLRRHEISTRIIHCPVQKLSAQECAQEVAELSPRLVGISTLFSETDMVGTLALAHAIKELAPYIHVSVGGHPVTFIPLELLARVPQVDSVVSGEGEYTLLELVQRLVAGRPWQDVTGLSARRNGKLHTNSPRPLIDNLDELPFPAHDIMYLLPPKLRSASAISSRGCPNHCTFCSVHPFFRRSPGKVWRWRNPQNVVDELEQLKQQWRLERISFFDDNFIGPGQVGKQRAYEIGMEMIRRKIQWKFTIECRADAVDEDLFGFLKCVGLYNVFLGIESGVQRVLDLYHKQTTVDINRRALDILTRLGFDIDIGFIGFDPFNTLDDIRENIRFYKQTGLVDNPVAISAFFGQLTVFRNTEIEKALEKHGLLRDEADEFGLTRRYRFADARVAALAQAAQSAAERPSRRYVMSGGFSNMLNVLYSNVKQATGLSHEALRQILKSNGLVTSQMIESWREQSVRLAFQTLVEMVETIDDITAQESGDEQAIAERLVRGMQARLLDLDKRLLGVPLGDLVKRIRAISASRQVELDYEGRHYEIEVPDPQ